MEAAEAPALTSGADAVLRFYQRHAPDVGQVWSGAICHQKVAWTMTTAMTAAMWKSMSSIASLIGRADLARRRGHSMGFASRSKGPEMVGGMPGLRWGCLAGAESALACACGAAGGGRIGPRGMKPPPTGWTGCMLRPPVAAGSTFAPRRSSYMPASVLPVH